MAHIANCLFDSSTGLGLNNYIARELSPHPPYESVCCFSSSRSYYSPDLETKDSTSRDPSNRREGEVRLEDASTQRDPQIFDILKREAFNNGRTQEPGLREHLIVRARRKQREGPIHARRWAPVKIQGPAHHSNWTTQNKRTRIGAYDNGARNSHGFS
jgi:hypothetical protein